MNLARLKKELREKYIQKYGRYPSKATLNRWAKNHQKQAKKKKVKNV